MIPPAVTGPTGLPGRRDYLLSASDRERARELLRRILMAAEVLKEGGLSDMEQRLAGAGTAFKVHELQRMLGFLEDSA